MSKNFSLEAVAKVNWNIYTDALKERAALVGAKMLGVANRVWSIVSKVLQVSVSAALFLAAPYFFSAGAILGFIITVFLPNKVPRVIAAIQVIWTSQPWLTLAAMGVAAFLSLPVTLASTSILWGAYLGSELSLKAQELLGYDQEG